jgi:two-component system phosphate regulon response regulator PhoB
LGPSSSFRPAPLVLVGEDDDGLRSLLDDVLQGSGLDVLTARDARSLADLLQRQTADVLVLDSQLAGVEAGALCARLRASERTRDMAIIVLASGLGAEGYAELLESGADACIAKPFSPQKLISCIRAVLRDARRVSQAAGKGLLTFADLEMDTITYAVRRNGRIIHLAPTEFRLLHHLLLNPRKVYSREELQSAAWRRSVHLGPRTVDVHIGRLRRALKEAGGPDLIRTVRSVGYSLSD